MDESKLGEIEKVYSIDDGVATLAVRQEENALQTRITVTSYIQR